MISAITASFPMALGIALSPLPIAAIVMMLMTKRARTNAPSFLLGWVIGLLVVGIIVFMIPARQTENGEPTAIAGYIRIAVGVLLVIMALRQWRGRPGADEPVEVPRFLAGLDSFTGVKSLLSGFALVVLNPKNLPLCAAGAAAIDLVTENLTQQFAAYLVFTLVAASTVAFPIIAYLAARQHAEVLFESWKEWLVRNNQPVVAVILLIVGVLLIVRGWGMLAQR